MIKVDQDLLIRVGLGTLRPDLARTALRTFYDVLEMRVGIALADRMTNEQLDEFEAFFQAKDDAGAFNWLSTNFPDYREVVQSQYEQLEAEAAADCPAALDGIEALLAEFSP
jgi:hypothetical protein